MRHTAICFPFSETNQTDLQTYAACHAHVDSKKQTSRSLNPSLYKKTAAVTGLASRTEDLLTAVCVWSFFYSAEQINPQVTDVMPL